MAYVGHLSGYEPIIEKGMYLITNISDCSVVSIKRYKEIAKKINKIKGFEVKLKEASKEGCEDWKGLWANKKAYEKRNLIWKEIGANQP